MDINAAIIDQQLLTVVENIKQQAKDELGITGDKLKPLAFVHLAVKTMLDLDDGEAFDCLTEGGGDFGVDAIHLSEERDGEFTVSLFQGKYKKSLEANAHFPEKGLVALIHAIRHLFDPSSAINNVNNRVTVRIEEIRSLIRDGFIPQVRVLACNNGMRWNEAGEEEIRRSGFRDQVSWEHVNHDRLVAILQASKPVNDSLQMRGKAVVEDFDYIRVMVGRIGVEEIAALVERHGDKLLERNIRRYLGLHGNRVNEGIRDTLIGNEHKKFYFYNNGITLTCDKFTYNALQGGDFQVRIENLQVINGGQTCITIYKTFKEINDDRSVGDLKDAYVLVRLYQLPGDSEDLVRKITYATNSQNPVDLRDLRANDEVQQRLELDISQLGYVYKRKRSDASTKPQDITPGTVAEAVLSTWRHKPHQAKFFAREHFGKLYDVIFKDLNAAQAIAAVLLYRLAENRRKRPVSGDPLFIRYASCFLTMCMGKYLLLDLDCAINQLSHLNFHDALSLIDENGNNYFNRAVEDVTIALSDLYGDIERISLQQLSATFRRGDLIGRLE